MASLIPKERDAGHSDFDTMMEITMTALPFSLFAQFQLAAPKPTPTERVSRHDDDVERRKIVSEMIATGACDSEYGVQMLMSVFPGKY